MLYFIKQNTVKNKWQFQVTDKNFIITYNNKNFTPLRKLYYPFKIVEECNRTPDTTVLYHYY